MSLEFRKRLQKKESNGEKKRNLCTGVGQTTAERWGGKRNKPQGIGVRQEKGQERSAPAAKLTLWRRAASGVRAEESMSRSGRGDLEGRRQLPPEPNETAKTSALQSVQNLRLELMPPILCGGGKNTAQRPREGMGTRRT